MKLVLPALTILWVAAAPPGYEVVKKCIYERCPKQAENCNEAC